MPEQGVKFLCKRAIENGQRQLTPVEKELLKKGIDDAVKNKVCNDCTLYFLPHKKHIRKHFEEERKICPPKGG